MFMKAHMPCRGQPDSAAREDLCVLHYGLYPEGMPYLYVSSYEANLLSWARSCLGKWPHSVLALRNLTNTRSSTFAPECIANVVHHALHEVFKTWNQILTARPSLMSIGLGWLFAA